jgi:hypothetical protein
LTIKPGFRTEFGLPNMTVVYAQMGNFDSYTNGGTKATWSAQASVQTATTCMVVTSDVGQGRQP